jgi:uncharacterized membrane protein
MRLLPLFRKNTATVPPFFNNFIRNNFSIVSSLLFHFSGLSLTNIKTKLVISLIVCISGAFVFLLKGSQETTPLL